MAIEAYSKQPMKGVLGNRFSPSVKIQALRTSLWIPKILMLFYISSQRSVSGEYGFTGKIQIKQDIHKSKNRTKDAMNNALIDIGIRNKNLNQKALAVAKVIASEPRRNEL